MYQCGDQAAQTSHLQAMHIAVSTATLYPKEWYFFPGRMHAIKDKCQEDDHLIRAHVHWVKTGGARTKNDILPFYEKYYLDN